MSAPTGNFKSPKFGDYRKPRKSRFMANREEMRIDSEAEYADKLHRKSRQPVNATVPLTAIGTILILLGVVLGLVERDGFFFWILALAGAGLLLLTAITRPLERIHTQLTEINDKMGD